MQNLKNYYKRVERRTINKIDIVRTMHPKTMENQCVFALVSSFRGDR